jgi:glycosyltransferase involved in cell wall biosynthesis
MLRVFAFRSLDLSEYDIIISSSSAESKQVKKTRPGQIHICYCHTPIRYYWSHYDEYRRNPGLGKLNWLARLTMPVLVPSLKRADYKAAQQVDLFVANSSEVAKRIKKYYDKDSVVLNPPVDIARFEAVSLPTDKREGYLAHGRQVPYKRYDLAIEACNQLGLPLIVSGSGPDHDRLKSIAGPTIEFRSGLSDEAVATLFGSVKAYIFAAEEDFGIVQVEALAAGTPVVAYAAGGSRDIITDGVNGSTFNEQTPESLMASIKKLTTLPFEPEALRASAERFSTDHFVKRLKDIVSDSNKTGGVS